VGCGVRRQWLLIVSGARPEVLAQCESERVKFESLGWAIVITGGLAVVSMWFALNSALGINSVIAVPIALLWGLAIVGIDRWLVTSLPLESQRRWVVAVPRLALAILLGALISTPLVLRIFQPEIDAQISVIKANAENNFLQSVQHSQVAQQVTQWQRTVTNLEQVIDSGGAVAINPASDPVIKSLTAQLSQERAIASQDLKTWQCQLYGTYNGVSCPKGNGPLAQASQRAYEADQGIVEQLTTQIQNRESVLSATDKASQESRLQQARQALPSAQLQLRVAQQRQDELQGVFDAANASENGLLIRLQALSQLSNGNTTVASARFLLFLLFLVIECLPLAVKLLQRPGIYEKIFQVLQERELAQAKRSLRGRWHPAVAWDTEAGTASAADVDDDILRIWQERAGHRTAALPVAEGVGVDLGWRDPLPLTWDEGDRLDAPGLADRPSVAHEDLLHMRDERIPADTDGTATGIPLRWDDDL
jgi:hypothetical protein